MEIAKHGAGINDLTDWKRLAGPKDAERQWVEGRSEVEVARAWLSSAPAGPPDEVARLLTSNDDFRNVVIDTVEPDASVSFNTHRGGSRSADLVFLGHDDLGSLVGTVEAKADEPFGPRVSEVLNIALERAVSNPRSSGIDHVVELVRGLIPARTPDCVSVVDLRYQLLTALAGTLAVAAKRHAERAVFIVHVFETDKTSLRGLAANGEDLSQFIRRLSSGSIGAVEEGVLHGPIQVRGEALAARPAALYVGKVTRRLSEPTL